MLSPLQRKVLEIVRSIEGTEGLPLAGGGGLIVQGVVDRETEDLDPFRYLARRGQSGSPGD